MSECKAKAMLESVFDANRVNEELGAQVEITKAFDQERRKVKTDINKKEQDLRAESEAAFNNGDFDLAKDKLIAADKVQNQGLLFDTISGAMYGPNTNGTVGYVAKAASPFVSNQIGQYYKDLADNQGGNLTGAQQAGHILAHGILGAATSSATGNDALTGGLSASTGEAAAPLISNFLYGTTDPSKLTAEQKDTISSITSALGAGIGAATGNTSDAVNAAETSKVAVENNHLNYRDTLARESWKSVLEGCEGSQIESCMLAREQILALNAKDAFQRESLLVACNDPTSANCTAAKAEAKAIYKELTDAARSNGKNNAYDKERNEVGRTLSSLPTGTITAIDPYEDYLKTFEGRLAKSTAEGLMLEVEGFAVAKLLQPLTKAGSKAYSASRKWKSSEVALATGIEKNVKSLSSSELKLLDDYLLGKKIPPITYADRARQSNANLSKVLNDLGKTSAAQTKLEKQVALQNMSDLLNVRQRSLALAPEPSQAKINMAEGIGAARYEQATGRTVTRSTDPAVDFIDPKIGAFDLKGPIRSKTGAKIPITPKMRADFAKSVIKEANISTASKAVVVDTLGLSKSEVQSLKSTINNGIKTKKPIIYLE